jgi:hypothetical protein
MAYIGVSPSNGVRQKHTYTATASQTTFSGAGSEGISLSYRDSNYVDVYRNGVKLGDADYTATSGTSIVLGEGAAVSDIIEIVTYDVFSVADTVSKADGGTFDGNVTMAGTLAVTGETTLSANLNLGDNDKVIFGDDDDFEIRYNSATGENQLNLTSNPLEMKQLGTNSVLQLINGGTNHNQVLQILKGSTLHGSISTDTNKLKIDGIGSLELSDDGSTKLATTSTGIDVTGTVVSDGMSTNTAGTSNFIAGVNAGNSITSGGNFNTVVGDEAGTALTTGDDNTALGYGALYSEDAHGKNTAVGTNSLLTLNAGVDGHNTAVGYFSGRAITTGVQNTLIGSRAGDALTDADFNVAIGDQALTTDTQGSRSIAIGYGALSTQNFTSATNSHNTAVGHASGAAITTGTLNTLVGALSGDALNTGAENVALGYNALSADVKGNNSIAIGSKALQSQSFSGATDVYNTAVGHNAGKSVTTGVQNTLIGGLAGDALTTGNENTVLGYDSLGSDTKGKHSVAIGHRALTTQNFTSTTDNYNIAIGTLTLASLTTGVNNTFVGGLSGDALTDADDNVGIGLFALSASTQDSRNVAIGANAFKVLNYGSQANFEAVAVGYDAGKSVTTGLRNQLFGAFAGKNIDTGQKNTCVGYDSGATLTSGGQNTCLGFEANVASASANNSITLGNADVTALRCQQTSISSLSDVRDKTDIIDLPYGLDFINKTRPVQFKWNLRDAKEESTLNGTIRNGFIAQELQDLGNNDQHQLVYDENPEKLEARYGNLMPMLVKAVQELSAQVTALQSELKTIKGK